MSFLHDPFWQFIISTSIAIAGIIIPLAVGFVQSKGGGGSSSLSVSPSSNPVGCWIVPTIIVSMILIILVVFSGVVFAFVSNAISTFQISNLTSSTPNQTLNTYCQDVQSGDYQGAYDEYSAHLKSQVSSAQFTQMWVNKHLDSCTHDTVNTSGNQATTTLSTHDFFTRNSEMYSVTLIQDGSNGWKIDNIQRL